MGLASASLILSESAAILACGGCAERSQNNVASAAVETTITELKSSSVPPRIRTVAATKGSDDVEQGVGSEAVTKV